MLAPAPPAAPMTADAFIDWAMAQPSGRFELEAGQVVEMAAERLAHVRVESNAWAALRSAIRAAGLGCEAFADGPVVPIDDATVYEPDALVRCGDRLPGDQVRVTDPVIVVEVLSPSSASRDHMTKLAGYFRVPSLHHYLILDPDKRLLVHHARTAREGEIATRIATAGPLPLDPPGLLLDVVDLFADA